MPKSLTKRNRSEVPPSLLASALLAEGTDINLTWLRSALQRAVDDAAALLGKQDAVPPEELIYLRLKRDRVYRDVVKANVVDEVVFTGLLVDGIHQGFFLGLAVARHFDGGAR